MLMHAIEITVTVVVFAAIQVTFLLVLNLWDHHRNPLNRSNRHG